MTLRATFFGSGFISYSCCELRQHAAVYETVELATKDAAD